MKAFLLYRDRDFDLQRRLPPNAPALTQDLELSTLFNAMALGDKFLLEVAQKAVLSSATDLDTIHYRQHILRDCMKNASIVREIYTIAMENTLFLRADRQADGKRTFKLIEGEPLETSYGEDLYNRIF